MTESAFIITASRIRLAAWAKRNVRVPHDNFVRRVLVLLCLAFALLTGGCRNLIKVTDTTIPKMITPVAEADFDKLLTQLKPFVELQSLRTTHVDLRFIEAEAQERIRFDPEAIMVLQRPDRLRLIVQAPVAKKRVAEMVSESNHFKVAIYYPDEYRHFLLGTNDADYSRWQEKMPTKNKSALANARPFHFTDALLMRPLRIGESGFAYSLEEAALEEPDTSKGAPRGARVLRSYYVVSELALPANGQAPARVRRRFWFDRTDQLRFARQQLFDERGRMATDVRYSAYQKLNAANEAFWPSVILVNRPHDGYAARFTFTGEQFEINPELPATAFALENTEKLPETDLDKPDKP